MKFIVENKRENITTLIRKIGYRYLGKNEETKEVNLVRPLEAGGYPRFHIFLKIDEKNQLFFFNLHLDQRRPVYKGTRAHAADYRGEVVVKEAARIKQTLQE